MVKEEGNEGRVRSTRIGHARSENRARRCPMLNKSWEGYPHSNHRDNGCPPEEEKKQAMYNWDITLTERKEEGNRRIRGIPEGEGELISFLS